MKKVNLKLVLCTVALMVTATVGIHAEDWKGVDVSNMSLTGDGYFEAPIVDDATLTQLQTGGFAIQGVGFTLTSVDLIKSNGSSSNLFTGSVNFNTWSMKQDIDKSKFSSAAVGDIIRCTYTNKVTTGDNPYNPKFIYVNPENGGWVDFPKLQDNIYRDGVASNEVYIYNVDTGKFFYVGGAWGTHGELLYRDFGLKFKISSKTINGEDRFLFWSDVSTKTGGTTGYYLGMMRNNTPVNANGITVDKNEIYHGDNGTYCYCRFKAERVEDSGDTYTYKLSLNPSEFDSNLPNKKFYLSVSEETKPELDIVEKLSVVEKAEDEEGYSKPGQWRFVPISEIDAAVRNAALDVDAFNGMNLDVTYKIDNQGFNRNNENNWTESGATYKKKSDDNYALTNPAVNGKYYYGLMSSANANGTISRSFTAPATGWYKVQCQGVSKSGNAVVYAKANGNDAVSAPLNQADVDTYNDITNNADARVNLGIDFYNNEYPAEVYVHATKGQTIELGIMQTAAYNTGSDLTAFDDFQIKYLGEIFVLDEDYTESTAENEYTTGHDGVTVVLHRTFSKNESGEYYWNTLTLPIDMTGTQVKNVFGDDVQLAKATGLDQNNPYIITFKSQDINLGITAGELYLIKPAKEPATPVGQSKEINGKTYNGPLYTLGRRDVSAISDEAFTKDRWSANNHNDIQYHATYVKKVGGVPASSYVFSKGNMYHTTSDLTIKGFRFWIQDEEASQSSGAKPFTISISGIDDQLENEGIATSLTEASVGYNDNASVYSLSGQFIGKGRELLSRLPKGIYVVNNKKYLVK